MAVDVKAVNIGISEGFESLAKYFAAVPEGLRNGVEKKAIEILEFWPEELPPRFVKLFAELVAIAEVSRKVYGHPPLSRDDLLGFLGHCRAFFNSFTHK